MAMLYGFVQVTYFIDVGLNVSSSWI